MSTVYKNREVKQMPELSRFDGMVIYMLFRDNKQHNKPHVHVFYGEYEAAIGIDGELLAGTLPKKQFKIVVFPVPGPPVIIYNPLHAAL